ncbi:MULTISPECIES: hypothetical protein [unclassified Methylobacterium]|uniref:hypothetical protein n=1 Tax=unclassified Methylobacterium TaxID=2615210 RepID=UPI0005BE296A|nr:MULTISPECIES: hypothetical protein [unclassified Methylobacterium]
MADLEALFDKAGAGFWKTRSDDELLEMEFTTDDPESLDNVSNDPPPDEEAMVELAYNVAGRERGRAQCVFCKHPNHDRGVVMLYRSGGRRLVGRDCAHKRYGVVFDELVKDFDAARDRRDYVERQRTVLSQRTDLVDQIAAMARDPAVKAFADIQRQLRAMLGKSLWAKLQRIADGDGLLTAEEQLRDYGSGNERVRGVIVQGDALHGAELFRSGPSVSDQLMDIEIDVAMTLEALRQPDVTTREIRIGLVKLGDLMRRIEEQRVRLRAVNSFFEIYNLGHLARWAAKVDRQVWIATGTLPNRLVVQRGSETLECAAPEHYRVPGQSLVALMRDTVTSQKEERRRA